jgi:hypothetical protein
MAATRKRERPAQPRIGPTSLPDIYVVNWYRIDPPQLWVTVLFFSYFFIYRLLSRSWQCAINNPYLGRHRLAGVLHDPHSRRTRLHTLCTPRAA